jgi:hypothetical protein
MDLKEVYMFARRDHLKAQFMGVLLVIALMAAAGCASAYKTVLPTPPDSYKKLGVAKGKACGSMLILATAYNFIPISLNERVENAYQNALASVPGATALMNVTMQENWYWWLIGSTKCVTITGEAIQ